MDNAAYTDLQYRRLPWLWMSRDVVSEDPF